MPKSSSVVMNQGQKIGMANHRLSRLLLQSFCELRSLPDPSLGPLRNLAQAFWQLRPRVNRVQKPFGNIWRHEPSLEAHSLSSICRVMCMQEHKMDLV